MMSRISPQPLYLDKDQVFKIMGYLAGCVDKLTDNSIINIIQSSDLVNITITYYDDGITPSQTIIL